MTYKDAGKKRVFQLNWITARKRKYIEQMGCCVFCGSLDNIQIHHLDSSTKWSHRIWSYSQDIVELELSKCIALCGHCHGMYHALLRRKTYFCFGTRNKLHSGRDSEGKSDQHEQSICPVLPAKPEADPVGLFGGERG